MDEHGVANMAYETMRHWKQRALDAEAKLAASEAENARLRAYIFDVVSGAAPTFTARERAETCALLPPKAAEILAVAKEWFDQEISSAALQEPK